VEIDRDPGATAGLLVIYNSRLYAGLGVSDANLAMHRYGMERTSAKLANIGRRVFLRLTSRGQPRWRRVEWRAPS